MQEETRREGYAGPRFTLWGIRPYELYSALAFVATIVFLRSRGMRMDWNTIDYTLGPFLPMAAWLLFAGVGLQVIYHALGALRRGEGLGGGVVAVGSYLRTVATPGWIVLWLRLYLAYALMIYCYNWLKVTVPLVNHRLWDAELFDLDRWLHLGISPTLFAVELVAGTPLVGLIDHWYAFWLTTVLYSITFFVTARKPDLRCAFLLSCAFLWTLGALIYQLIPALGPIYAYADHYREVLPELPKAAQGHRALLENYQVLLSGRTGQLYQFNPTRGIAAMPSLHVGAHVMLTLWSRRFVRPLYMPCVVGTGLTFLGSLVTGWHYAVDAYVGTALAFGCYWFATWLEGLQPAPRPDGRAAGSAAEGSPSNEGSPDASGT